MPQGGHLLKTESNVGMWKQLLKQSFNEKVQKPSILHKGCDVRGKQCDCGACPKEMFKVVLILAIFYCLCTVER